MALFTPENMQAFGSAEIMVSDYRGNSPATAKRYFTSKKTLSQWLNLAKTLKTDSLNGRKFSSELEGKSSDSWAGTSGQKTDNILETGIIENAFNAFKNAEAKLQTPLTRNSPTLSPVGGAFSIGRIIIGHPKACITRPKTKLPHKTIDLVLNVSAGINADRVTQSLVKIARAAWEYKIAGGTVDLTVNFLHKFSRTQEWNGQAHYGILDTIKLDAASIGQFASGASVQFYRALSIPLASALSGDPFDCLPLVRWANPSAFRIDGTEDDSKALQALRVA